MTGRPSVGVPTVSVSARWLGEGLRFEGRAGERLVRLDGHSKESVSPVEALVIAAATCTGADVVLILEKQRVQLRTLDIDVLAERRPTEPRRVTALHLRFAVSGEGVSEDKVRRAVELSLEKYCTVVTSLAPDTRVTYDVTIS